MESDSLMFQVEVAMTADVVLEWLCGSNTNSVTDLTDHQLSSQEHAVAIDTSYGRGTPRVIAGFSISKVKKV